MRHFSDTENQLIKELVEAKLKGISSIQNLQAAKILRKQFDFFALKWTIGDNPTVSIYCRHTEDKAKLDDYNKIYFKIADFIYFIKELESLGFIAIQKITNKQERKYSLLYDRKKYTYDESTNKFNPINEHPLEPNESIIGDTSQFEEVSPGLYCLMQVDRYDINLDFAHDLERYGLGIIYILPVAEDYVKNSFHTLEELQFKKQMGTALKSAKYGRFAAILGAISVVFSFATLLYTLFTDDKPTKIDSQDIERIESAINSNHLSQPFEIFSNDTLVIKQVHTTNNPTKNKKPNAESATIPSFDNR